VSDTGNNTQYLQYGDGTTTQVPSTEIGYTVTVVFAQATSQVAGKPATGGDSGGQQKTYTLTVGANTDLNVVWNNDNQPTQPIAAGTYQYDLNTDAKTTPQGSNSLINTTDGSSNTYGDTYTFTLSSITVLDTNQQPVADTNWQVVSDSGNNTQYLQYGDGTSATVPTTEMGYTVKVVFSQAISEITGKAATGGDSGGQQKTYTLTVGANTNLNVTWNNNNQPTQPIVVSAYKYDLNTDAKTTPQGSNALINTTDGSSNTYGDTYTFTLGSIAVQDAKGQPVTDANWKVVSDTGNNTQYLQYGDGTTTQVPASEVGYTVKVIFSQAESQVAGKPATGGDSGGQQKTYTLTVGPNSALNVTWNSNVPPTPTVGNVYNYWFNSGASTASSSALIYTTDTSGTKYGDAYTFILDTTKSSIPSGWRVVTDTSDPTITRMQYGTGVQTVPSSEYGKTIKVVFSQATSKTAGKQATGSGESPDTQKTYILTVGPNSNLNVTWNNNNKPTQPVVTSPYKFDLNTDAKTTPQGSNALINTTDSSSTTYGDTYTFALNSITIQDTSGQPVTDANWKVVSDTGNNTQYLQYGDGTSTTVPNSEIGYTVKVIFSQAESQVAGKPATGGDSGGQQKTYTLTVAPNTNLDVVWNNSNQPVQPLVSDTYKYDLNSGAKTTPQGSNALINTQDGSSTSW
jgi:hypothetical protein